MPTGSMFWHGAALLRKGPQNADSDSSLLRSCESLQATAAACCTGSCTAFRAALGVVIFRHPQVMLGRDVRAVAHPLTNDVHRKLLRKLRLARAPKILEQLVIGMENGPT